MRAIAVISKTLMWAALVVYLFFQTMEVIGISSNNAKAINAGRPEEVYSVIPLVVAAAAMLIGAVVFAALRRRRYIGIIIGVVAAAIMLMVALDLGRAFPVQVNSYGDTGLSTAKLIWRHIGIAVVPVFMLAGWLAEHFADKAAALADKGKHGYDLSGDPIFKDAYDTTEDQKPRRPKRSVRKRQENR